VALAPVALAVAVVAAPPPGTPVPLFAVLAAAASPPILRRFPMPKLSFSVFSLKLISISGLDWKRSKESCFFWAFSKLSPSLTSPLGRLVSRFRARRARRIGRFASFSR
jgi:hypothetical protein